MHFINRTFLFLVFVVWAHLGCGGSPDLLQEIPASINTVKSGIGPIKQVAAILIQAPDSGPGQTAADLYLKTLVEAIGDEDARLNLLTPQDAGFPDFMAALADTPSASINAVSLSEQGRQAGFQGLLTAAVGDIRAVAKKTGIFWMRKTRHFIQYTVTMDLYDPYTAAKIVSEVIEGSIKISEEEYGRFQAGQAFSIAALNEKIEEAAQDHGELIAQTLQDHQWRAAVSKVQAGRIFIPVGRKTGLAQGDRLAVFEGRRQLESKAGGKYIVPGLQVGEIQITAVTEHMVEAKAMNAEDIQEGDIVIPIK